MKRTDYYIRQTFTVKLFYHITGLLADACETVGNLIIRLAKVMKFVLQGQISFKHLMEQSSRFAVDSLPITLTIVSMTSIILAVQTAPEMVKQGGGNYIGMLLTLITVRETGPVMTGFAIISMIGSALASETATMKVTDQTAAMQVLRVSPFKYLFVPRLLAGTIMMPLITVISSTVGILCGGMVTSLVCPDISGLNFMNSVKLGLFTRDIWIMLGKAACFGLTIAHISTSCGYDAKGGAKSVGDATTKAVVWSFTAIVIIDCIFAFLFYF